MTLSPELLAMVADVPAAKDEEIAAWLENVATYSSIRKSKGTFAHRLIARIVAERKAGAWQSMDTAPRDGKHCILAVKEGAFVYSVQGAFSGVQWNAVHRDNVEPLCWMPNVRIPTDFLPWEVALSALEEK